MNPKIKKVIGEIEKTKAKLSEYQARLRELERQKTELENAEIVELVRGVAVAPQDLAAFIAAYQQQGGAPAAPAITEQEEFEDEE